MRIPAIVACTMLAACASPHDHSAYAGQQDRAIKALSAQEVAGYRTGAGMGLAKAAELNGYPGPMHSLESAKELGLTGAQQEKLEALMQVHKEEARHLGAEVIRLEGELDTLFAKHAATPQAVDAKLAQIASTQASLRASHLKAHLATTALLTPEQIDRYKRARGY